MEKNKYLTSEKDKSFKFEKIEIKWNKNDLYIKFLDEGYATETFFAIKCYHLSELFSTRDLFVVRETEKGEIKKLVEGCEILKMGYRSFIYWLTDKTATDSLENSEEFEKIPLSGIELRFDNHNKEYTNLIPSETGCKLIIDSTITWTSM